MKFVMTQTIKISERAVKFLGLVRQDQGIPERLSSKILVEEIDFKLPSFAISKSTLKLNLIFDREL